MSNKARKITKLATTSITSSHHQESPHIHSIPHQFYLHYQIDVHPFSHKLVSYIIIVITSTINHPKPLHGGFWPGQDCGSLFLATACICLNSTGGVGGV